MAKDHVLKIRHTKDMLESDAVFRSKTLQAMNNV